MTSVYVQQWDPKDHPLGAANEYWRYSFYTQCGLLIPMSLGFLMTPRKYLDIERTNRYRDKCQQKVQQQLYKYLNKGSIIGSGELGPRKSATITSENNFD